MRKRKEKYVIHKTYDDTSLFVDIIPKKLDKLNSIKASKILCAANRIYTGDINKVKEIIKKNKILYIGYLHDYIWGKHWEIVYK